MLVEGWVQGVGYRAFTERAAAAAGLGGWVRNLADGRVEAWLEGPPERIEAVTEQMREGPRAGRVASVRARSVTPAGHPGFVVRSSADRPLDPADPV